jgi:hypothetical protein
MTIRRPLLQISGLTLVALLLAGCGGALAEPTATPTAVPTTTPYPTYTPVPTMTPYPTYTPLPPTPTPTTTGVDEWLEGHFWSIKVAEVNTETELDGMHPTEDVFVVVDAQWKANDLEKRHIISGIDFQLVDDAGEQYDPAGMIFEEKTYDAYSDDAKFQKGEWVWTQASGTSDKTIRLVYDIPSSVTSLRLWFQDFPLIDLGLELP